MNARTLLRRAAPLAALVLLGLGANGLLGMARQQASAFPHARHAALFPNCSGCHGEIPPSGQPMAFPAPELCAQCHDGAIQPGVEWRRFADAPDNLRFSHGAHREAALARGDAVSCQTCHAADGTTGYMAVRAAEPAWCLDCHAHEAPAHLAAEAECSVCHTPLAEAAELAAVDIAAFPQPPSHAEPGFTFDHAPTVGAARQQCAVCHAVESCTRCHLNAAGVPAIAALGSDPRVLAAFPDRTAAYPLPASHEELNWLYAHGQDAAEGIATCANCHARPSCDACHIGEGARELIETLPEGPGGVQISGWRVSMAALETAGAEPGAASARHPEIARTLSPQQGESRRAALLHPPGFATEHGDAASTNQPTCASCHAATFCSDCHDGPTSAGFHPPNFVARHATDAYSRQTDCASCHNTQSFCKSCHEQAGLGSAGRLDVAFHNAQPLWLLQHAQAARQGLESCATCHAERDCQQCHSATGGWRISPHGPDFDPSRMADRNRLMCRRCHITVPGGG